MSCSFGCKDDESFYVDANQEVHQDHSGNQCFKEYAYYGFTKSDDYNCELSLQFPDESSMSMEDNAMGINYMPLDRFRCYKQNRDGFYEEASYSAPRITKDGESYLFNFPNVTETSMTTPLYKIEMYSDQCEANGEHYWFIEYYYMGNGIVIHTDLTEYNGHRMSNTLYNLENCGADSLVLDSVVCKKCLEVAE